MRRSGSAAAVLALALGAAAAPAPPEGPVPVGRGQVSVLVFTRTDCPISNRYAPELRRLRERFAPKVHFTLVYPDPSEPSDAVEAHARDFALGFELVRDPEHALVRLAGATVTPEAAVFVGTGGSAELVYRGRVDDRHVDFGRSRPEPSRKDLAEVLEALAAGQAVAPRTTPSVGCTIAPLEPAPRAPVTFNRDVAPIVFRSCLPCHRPGEAGPFSLERFSDVRRRGAQIVRVTSSRYMPPWPPEPGHGDFAGARRLTDAEIAVLARWVASGMPEGAAKDLPPLPQLPRGWQLGPPDLVLEAPPLEVPAEGTDVFHNLVLPAAVRGQRYVRAIEVHPGDKRLVHHANVLLDRAGSARRLDEGSPGPGFPGMDVELESASFEPDGHFLFWKPGTAALAEPDDMAWRLDENTDLVLNLHLQPSGRAQAIRPTVGLYFTDRAPTRFPMLLQLEHDGALDIPPGARGFEVADHFQLPVDVEVLGVYPHAHYLGREIRGWAVLPDGTERSLLWIRDWDLNWQAVYRYRQPIALPRGTTVHMSVTYDNSEENPRNPTRPPRRVVGGNRSTDEMGHVWLQVLPKDGDQRLVLQEAFMRRRLQKYPGDFVAHVNLAAALEARQAPDEALEHYAQARRARPGSAAVLNNVGALQQSRGRIEPALEAYREAVRVDPEYLSARYNLGNALAARGDFGEAVEQFRHVVTRRPGDVRARSNLGGALLAAGRAEEAIAELSRAVSADPASADAQYNLARAFVGAGRPADAVAPLEAAVRLRPEDPDLRQDLAALKALLAGQ
jgi:Flp pilus assembly protein TadD